MVMDRNEAFRRELVAAYLREGNREWNGERVVGGSNDARLLQRHPRNSSTDTVAQKYLRELAFEVGLRSHQTDRILSSATAGSTPPELFGLILIFAEMHGAARRLFRPAETTAGELDLSGIATNVTAHWTDEGTNSTAEDFTFSQGKAIPKKLDVLVPLSRELKEDAPPELLDVILEAAGAAMGKQEDLAAFIGDGTPTYGKFTGILNASTNIVTMDPSQTSIDKVNVDDMRSLRDAVPAARRLGAAYMLSPTVLSTLQSRKDLQGRGILVTDSQSGKTWLYNHPVETIAAMDSITDSAGVKFAAFGDPQNAAFITRKDIELKYSRAGLIADGDNLITANALASDLIIAIVRERIAPVLLDPTAIAVLRTAAS
jgi:HK97 family phage major capsid protein